MKITGQGILFSKKIREEISGNIKLRKVEGGFECFLEISTADLRYKRNVIAASSDQKFHITIKTKSSNIHIRKCNLTSMSGYSDPPTPGDYLIKLKFYTESVIVILPRNNSITSHTVYTTWGDYIIPPNKMTKIKNEGRLIGLRNDTLIFQNLSSEISIRQDRKKLAQFTVLQKGEKGWSTRNWRNLLFLLSYLQGERLIPVKKIFNKRKNTFIYYYNYKTYNINTTPIDFHALGFKECNELFNLLIAKFWENNDKYQLALILDYYISSLKAPLWSSNLMLYSILEFLNSKLRKSDSNLLINQDLFDNWSKDAINILNKTTQDINEAEKSILINKIKNLNKESIPFKTQLKVWIDELKIHIQNDEWKEINSRNKFMHGYGLKYHENWKETLKNLKIISVVLNKIFLKLLGTTYRPTSRNYIR